METIFFPSYVIETHIYRQATWKQEYPLFRVLPFVVVEYSCFPAALNRANCYNLIFLQKGIAREIILFAVTGYLNRYIIINTIMRLKYNPSQTWV